MISGIKPCCVGLEAMVPPVVNNNTFFISASNGEFSVLRFDGATKEWLEFVVNNRRGKGKNSYDLIMGPVANDQLYATIRLYEQGVVTADAAIEMLKTHKLFNQLSFHTVKVIPLLKFTESIEV